VQNLERLIALYREDKRVAKIVAQLSTSPPPRTQLTGVVGAQDSFVLAGTYLAAPQFHLVICNDKEEAAYLQNNLANILGKKQVHFFPDSFKRPANFDQLNNTNVLQRTETINKITESSALGELIITYPEALFEQVVAPSVLAEKKIRMVKGEKMDVDFIIEILVEYGFERTDFVYLPASLSSPTSTPVFLVSRKFLSLAYYQKRRPFG